MTRSTLTIYETIIVKQFQNIFTTPKENSIPFSTHSLPPLDPSNLSVCMNLPIPDIPYIWNHTSCGLSLASITQQNVLKDLTSLVAQMVKRLPRMWETQVQSLGQGDSLEKEMATHFSTLAWKIPWMEEPRRLQSMGVAKSRTRLKDFTFTFFLFSKISHVVAHISTSFLLMVK